MQKTSTVEFKKAIQTLSEGLDFAAQHQGDKKQFNIARDACLQRFEYCIELAWKVSMRLLGSQVKHAKVAVREMARADLIDSAELWLAFVEARNDTSHSYDENIAQRVFEQIKKFCPEAEALLSRLEKIS